MGGALARNEGIFQSTGEYITFLDDDDEYQPRKIEKQLDFMLSTECDMSFTNLKLVNEKGTIIDYREHDELKKMDNDSLLKYHIMRHLTGTPTFMYKSDKLKEIGGFDDAKMGQEFYLMLKSIENNLNICYLKDCDVIAYRHTSGGISYGSNKIIGEKNLYRFKKQYFNNFTIRERMFIRFRHFAVMAVSYIRNENYTKAFINGTISFLVSPIDAIKEGLGFIYKIIKNKNKSKKNRRR